MKISREEFLAVVQTVTPALSSNKNQVEELSHIWFDGEAVSAFDDLIGIKVDFKTEFTGGIRGDKLLGVLANSAAKELSVEVNKGGNLFMKIGRAQVTFALRPIDDWFWEPEVPKEEGFPVTKEFFDAIKLTLLSVGSSKITNAEQRGVTIIQHDTKQASLYSTDALSISRMTFDNKGGIFSSFDHEYVIVPTPFCEQLTMFSGEATQLSFDERAVYCTGSVKVTDDMSAKALLFGKLVESDEIPDFENTIKGYSSEAKVRFSVPEGFKMSLDRALVLLSDGKPAELGVSKDKLYLVAVTDYGDIDDEIKLPDSKHPDIKVDIDLALVRRGIEGRESMAITPDCLVLTGPAGFTHIVSTKE